MINESFLKAWDYSGQATLVDSFTQTLQRLYHCGKKKKPPVENNHPAEAKRAGRKQNHSRRAAALPQQGGWRYTKHVPLPGVGLDMKLAGDDLMESMKLWLWLCDGCFWGNFRA